MVHLHLWCFQLTAVWEESALVLLAFGTNDILKRETFRNRFQVTGFKQKFALGSNKSLLWLAKIKSALFNGIENSMQKNSGI